MKILVTGGCGFIGSHLVNRLIDEGNEVIVIDDLSMGNVKNLRPNERLSIKTVNILENIDYYFRDIDIVYHLAAITRPQQSFDDPELFSTVNITGTLRVLERSVKHRIKKFVFVSTTGIYGDQKLLPIPETALPDPMSPYAFTKLSGELLCQLYSRVYGLKYNIIRPFNVYGSRQSPNGGYSPAIPNFIKGVSEGTECYITGDGTQARDFVYVEDVVDLIIKSGNSDVSGEIFNAGSGVSTSINEIYSIVCKFKGKNTPARYIKAVFEPKQTLGAIDKAEFMLGWKPKTGIEEGIALTIKETNENLLRF